MARKEGSKPNVRFPIGERMPIGLLATSEEIESAVEKQKAADRDRLLTLCRYYGIAQGPEQHYLLALRLARELYPEARKRGAKVSWTDQARAALVVEIERLVVQGDRSKGAAWAATQLAKQPLWQRFGVKGVAETLRKAYMDSKSNWLVPIMRDAFLLHEAQGTISEWNKIICDCVKN